MAKPKRDIDVMVRTIVMPMKDRQLRRVAKALCHEAKNLYNTTMFNIRQVVSAYQWDDENQLNRLKPELHQHQIDAIAAFNAAVGKVNEDRRHRKGDTAKSLPLFGAEMRDNLYGILFDRTVLDHVVKGHKDQHGVIIYRRLPASSSQQVVLSVIDVWKASFEALKQYAQDPKHYTGKPGLPTYIETDGHFPLEVPYQMMTKGFPLPRQLEEFEGVSVEDQKAFYAFDIRTAIAKTCEKRGWFDYKPQHVRIVCRGGRIKLEAVVQLGQTYPEGSFLYRLLREEAHGATMRGHSRPKDREAFLTDYLKSRGIDGIRAAGIDVGQNNLCSVAFSSGKKGLVHLGKRYESKLKFFDERIDRCISALTTDRIKELQKLKSDAMQQNVPFSASLERELRSELKAVHSDEQLQKLRVKKDQWKIDYEHKLSHDIVDHCVRYGMDLIVVGQNKGMKEGQDFGSEKNRRSYNIAHHRIAALIRYKAAEHGIAVITTEESYTSKASFIDADQLPSYGDKNASEVKFSGTRTTNRNWFKRHMGDGKTGPAKLHSDINGAFNILRKIFHSFRYTAALSLKFELRWISPRVGVTGPMSCRMA